MKWSWLAAGLLAGALAAGLAADHAGRLDRLVSRLGGTTEAPAPPPAPSTPGPPRQPHGRRHWAAWLRKNGPDDEDDDDDEEEDDNELEPPEDPQADSARPRSFSASRSRWPSSRRNSEKWTSYRSGASIKPTGEVDDSAQNEVYRHNIKMSRETACRVPQLKVVRVKDHYPSASKAYLPSCTRLHQCADDTGCCGANQKCSPKFTEKVELYFYTTYGVPPQGSNIEKLPFYNHTECECRDISDSMPKDMEPHRFVDHLNARNAGCRCPSEYTVRQLANGSCACDCFDKQRDCTKYKKGKEYFNHQDRLCIETGSCTVPSCDFGAYLRRSGRCPRKHEKFRSWPRYHH